MRQNNAIEHVALLSAKMASALDSGEKRIESRLSRTRRSPYGKVERGDIIHFRRVGGALVGSYLARRVWHLHSLTPDRIAELQRRLNRWIAAPPAYWAARRACRYAVLIWLSRIDELECAPEIPRQYGTAWVVLPQRRNALATPQMRKRRPPRQSLFNWPVESGMRSV